MASGGSGRLPVFKSEVGNAREFRGVVSDEREIVRQSDGGDKRIVGADRSAKRGKVRADFRMLLGGIVVKWKGTDATDENLYLRSVLRHLLAAERSVNQLRDYNGTQAHFVRRKLQEARRDWSDALRSQVHDAHIGIKQMRHSRGTRCS